MLAWKLLGPFARDAAPPLPPADGSPLSYQDIDGRSIDWTAAAGELPHGFIDLKPRFDRNTDVAAFAWCEVDSPKDRQADLKVGSDDSVTVWVNGERSSSTRATAAGLRIRTTFGHR